MSRKTNGFAAGAPLPPALLGRVAERFAALADPTRLALLQLLCAGEASVQDLAAATGIAHSSASRHLAALAAQGFLVRRAQGTSAIYALADETPKQLCRLMCGHLAAEADALAALAGARRRARRVSRHNT